VETIDKNNIPKHIAVVMDGNGRWAKKKGAARIFGHRNALKAVRETIEACSELGVEFLTLYTFSSENWQRPQDEVDALMELLINNIVGEADDLKKNNVCLNAIGDLDRLPKKCIIALQGAMAKTAACSKMTLNLALSYSGRWDIKNAMVKIAENLKNESISIEDISEELISNHLSTAGMPDPELMIRTSGEMRISNFLMWQLAYSELYITEVLWPDFRKKDLHEAIMDYQKRQRRFGKTGEQVNK